MNLDQVEKALLASCPPAAQVGQIFSNSLLVPGLGVLKITLTYSRNGERRFAFTLADKRVHRDALQHLVCAERQCPKSHETRRRWLLQESDNEPAIEGQPSLKRVPSYGFRHRPIRVQPLIEETVFEVAGKRYSARPATWQCLRPCPAEAQGVQLLPMPGWDLFGAGRWIAGGITSEPTGPQGTQRPRFQAVTEIEQWLSASCAVTQAVPA